MLLAYLFCFGAFLPSCHHAAKDMKDADGATEGPEFIFFPEPPAIPRIQFLATYSTEKDVTGEPSTFRRFILGEKKYWEIGKPYGVKIHEGKIFVCDTQNGVVTILDLASMSLMHLGADSPGRLAKPINIAFDDDGNRYVADMAHKRLMIYDRHDNYVKAFGEPDAWSPSDVAVSLDRLYVTDIQNGQVVILDKTTGRELKRFCRKGSGESELFFPTNLDVDRQGNVYVSDTGNFRVLKFDSQGKWLQQFGTLGRAMGQFARPKGAAVDREGRLYVVDAAFENVQIFDRDARLLLFFGTSGNIPGGLNLPAKVSVDYGNTDLFADRVAPGHALEYLVLVSSQFGENKVNVYGYLKEKGSDETSGKDP